MSIRKRVLALAGAGVAALLVAGSFSAFHSQSPVRAGVPTNGAVGCATGGGFNIIFPSTISGATGVINGTQIPQANGSTTVGGLGFLSVLTPQTPVYCAPLLEDNDATLGVADLNNLTVDGGNLTATVAGPVTITGANSQVYQWGCGAAVINSCQGAQTPAAGGTGCPAVPGVPGCLGPTAANTFQVVFTPGTSLGAIGGFAPIVTVTVNYARFTVLNVGTFAVGTATITVAVPTYLLVLTVNNGTISAALPSAAIAQTANTTAVITATLYRATATPCSAAFAGFSGLVCTFGTPIGAPGGAPFGVAAPTFFFVVGGEPGVMTYQTSLGIWVGSSQSGGIISTNTAAQTIAVQCGQAPAGTPVILVPALGNPFQLGLTSCQNTSATLAGGGAAGTAAIVVTYAADYTGAFTQNSIEVNLVPGPSIVNLTTGCNEVITPPSLAPGSNSAAVLKLVTAFNVSSIWVFNNATHTFLAFYFSAAGAPTDISAVGGNQSIFICGTGAGTFQVSP